MPRILTSPPAFCGFDYMTYKPKTALHANLGFEFMSKLDFSFPLVRPTLRLCIIHIHRVRIFILSRSPPLLSILVELDTPTSSACEAVSRGDGLAVGSTGYVIRFLAVLLTFTRVVNDHLARFFV